MKFGRKSQGFTLVEIAIVLVIIGLLLGCCSAASSRARK
jgi:prepilin-type N-terminal cleavage/methylation domain-containing protein